MFHGKIANVTIFYEIASILDDKKCEKHKYWSIPFKTRLDITFNFMVFFISNPLISRHTIHFLTMYLEEPELPRKTKIDVLQYWKENQARFPRLALLARDLLSVQITTVASESSFSIGGRILSKYRSSLSPSSAEALLCTRDWLDLEDEKDEMEEELSENLEAYII